MCNNEYSDQRGAGTAEVSNYKLILQNAKRSERTRTWDYIKSGDFNEKNK